MDLSDVTYVDQETHKLIYKRCSPEYGDVLLVKDGVKTGTVAVNKLREEFSLLSSVALLKVNQTILSPYYLRYFLSSPTGFKMITNSMSGTAIKRIILDKVRRAKVVVPPLAEQQRIVDKIEELFSDLDSGVDSLKKARQQLKVYRQAVLKWAFEGKLTAQWREEQQRQGKLESADTLLAKIKAEREQRYQKELEVWQAEVEAWEANGKEGKKPRKPQKLKEPEQLTADDLKVFPKLPNGWRWLKLSQVAEISGGVTKNSKRENFSLTIPYLRVANVYSNKLDLSEVYEIGLREIELSRVLLKEGDLLIVEGNGSIDQIGRVAIWNNSINPCVHQNHLIKARPYEMISNKNVLYFLLSPKGRDFIKEQAATTSGLYTLSLSKVEELKIPLMSSAEQEKIVEEIESRLSICDQLESDIETNLKKAEALRQSILKQAFEGKLVPQDPNDEPASVLLERIRAEREAEQGNGKGRAKTRKVDN